MPGAELGEGVAKLAAAGVAERVVAHDGLHRAGALLGHPRGGALEGGRDGVLVLGAVQFAVGQAGVVIDDADDLDRARVAGAMRLAAVAVSPVAGAVELGQLERVDVQQRPGLGPLIAPRGLRALGAPLTTDTVTLEDLPDRRTVPTRQPRQAHRPPVGLRSGVEDRPLVLHAERPRARARPRGPRAQTLKARALLIAGVLPTMPPAVRGRRRDAQAGRGLPERRPLLDQPNQLTATLQSELAPTVLHVRPPSVMQSW